MNRRSALVGYGAAAFALLSLDTVYWSGLRLNTTASMPIGLWRVAPTRTTELRREMIVTVCLPRTDMVRQAITRGYIHTGSCPDGLEPLVKPIAALPGDVVAVDPAGIRVNGIPVQGTAQLSRDSGGRRLLPVPVGAYTVAEGDVWLLSGHDPRSFDSRYFGAVPMTSIQAAAHPVWVLQ